MLMMNFQLKKFSSFYHAFTPAILPIGNLYHLREHALDAGVSMKSEVKPAGLNRVTNYINKGPLVPFF